MKIIGITGGTGAGKSAVCDELKKCGAEIVDADKIARQIVQKGQPALVEITGAFGTEVLTTDGELNRKMLAGIVFSDCEKLKKLNEITHKYVYDEMKRQIESSMAEIVVLGVPLLFQCDFPIECDVTVAVIADQEERIMRVMQRDGIEREDALSRMSNQLTDKEYAEMADVCFENNGDKERIKEFAQELCRL